MSSKDYILFAFLPYKLYLKKGSKISVTANIQCNIAHFLQKINHFH